MKRERGKKGSGRTRKTQRFRAKPGKALEKGKEVAKDRRNLGAHAGVAAEEDLSTAGERSRAKKKGIVQAQGSQTFGKTKKKNKKTKQQQKKKKHKKQQKKKTKTKQKKKKKKKKKGGIRHKERPR